MDSKDISQLLNEIAPQIKRGYKSQLTTFLSKCSAQEQYELLGIISKLTDHTPKGIVAEIKRRCAGWDSLVYDKFKNIQHNKNLTTITPPEIEEGSESCKKCGSEKTKQYSCQTASGDESTSVYLSCCTCNHRWKL